MLPLVGQCHCCMFATRAGACLLTTTPTECEKFRVAQQGKQLRCHLCSSNLDLKSRSGSQDRACLASHQRQAGLTCRLTVSNHSILAFASNVLCGLTHALHAYAFKTTQNTQHAPLAQLDPILLMKLASLLSANCLGSAISASTGRSGMLALASLAYAAL